MFKHLIKLIFLLVLLTVVIITTVQLINRVFSKLYLNNIVIKYDLLEPQKRLFDRYSNDITIDKLEHGNKIIFYTDVVWSTKNNNYIYDIKNDRYFIIDKGYYYYLDNMKDYIMTVDKPIKIKLFDYEKYSSKINIIN